MATREELEEQRELVRAFKSQQTDIHQDNVRRMKRNTEDAITLMDDTFMKKMAMADAALAKIEKELSNAALR